MNTNTQHTITGKVVDLITSTLTNAAVVIENGRIKSISPCENVDNQFILPGFVDAHIHIESSMMPPSEFARHALACGTVACVCDPHEIANVCGVDGIDYMIEDAKLSQLKFFFGAPSCVPATAFDVSGAMLDAPIVEELLQRTDIHFLGEVMDYVAVVNENPDMMRKIDAALAMHKPVDGHAPNVSADVVAQYAKSGISTDHECMNMEEALAKIACGMKIQIREGSAAKNFDDLVPLIASHPASVMFCSDDKHPDDLMLHGHIDGLARRAIGLGYNKFDVLRACSLIPAQHYNLPIGLLQVGHNADFIVVDNLDELNVKATWVDGVLCHSNASPMRKHIRPSLINHFEAEAIQVDQIQVPYKPHTHLRVIEVTEGQLFTQLKIMHPLVVEGFVESDIAQDVLKIVQLNRYSKHAKPSVAFIRNFGLRKGAIASSIAHDSHNIIAVGTNDAAIVHAINAIVQAKGGIVAFDDAHTNLLALPIAGLMSNLPAHEIVARYQQIGNTVRTMGCTLNAPFMTLAFMSLVVIPEIKLGDKGLFDALKFEYIDLLTTDEVK